AAKGKHVFCEKPIAESESDAQMMINACNKAGVILMIGHVTRFNKEFSTARQQLLDGTLGKPGTVRTIRSGSFPAWGDWYAGYGDSGTLLDLAIHDLDYLRWC